MEDEESRRCNDEGEKCDEQCAEYCTECGSIIKCPTQEVPECLQEFPCGGHLLCFLSCKLGRELKRIERLIRERCCDLAKIEEEICLMKNALSNIPRGCSNVTSGSVIVEDPCSTQVFVAVKNRTMTAQSVRVRVLRDDVCPSTVLAEECLFVSGCCSNALTVPIDKVVSYEIEVYGLAPGLTVSSIELDVCRRRILCSRLTSSQFICLIGNCP